MIEIGTHPISLTQPGADGIPAGDSEVPRNRTPDPPAGLRDEKLDAGRFRL
jgi:hypothetical protein